MTNPDESDTARLVRWSTTATEAYTALYGLYEEMRESGHAYAWSAAYEASGQAGMVLAEVRELLDQPVTLRPAPADPNALEPPCRSTQHCASWGWCHRCDGRAAVVVPLVVKAVEAMGIRPDLAGSTYATVMDVLRNAPAPPLPAVQLPAGPEPDQGEPCPGK